MSGNEASKQAEPGGPLWFDLIPPEVSAVAATKHLDRGDSQRSQPTAKSGRLHLGLYLELPGDYSFGRTRHQAGLGFSWPREMSACHISRRCTREPPLSDSLSSLASRFGKAETLNPPASPQRDPQLAARRGEGGHRSGNSFIEMQHGSPSRTFCGCRHAQEAIWKTLDERCLLVHNWQTQAGKVRETDGHRMVPGDMPSDCSATGASPRASPQPASQCRYILVLARSTAPRRGSTARRILLRKLGSGAHSRLEAGRTVPSSPPSFRENLPGVLGHLLLPR